MRQFILESPTFRANNLPRRRRRRRWRRRLGWGGGMCVLSGTAAGVAPGNGGRHSLRHAESDKFVPNPHLLL